MTGKSFLQRFLGRSLPSFILWTIGILAGLLLLLLIGAFFIDEPLRRQMVKGMNAALDGYQVQIRDVDFHLIGLSVTVGDLVVMQEAHPEPPVAVFPRIDASVHWRELLTGNLVSDWRLYAPSLHINLKQLKKEREDEVPVEKRGWQQAVKEIYPLEINRLRISDGELTYIDDDPEKPLRLSKVDLTAENIRNIHSPERTYPSSFHLEADIFEQGHGTVAGEADFLASPHPGINARFNLENVPLERLRPVSARANLFLTGGILAGEGRIEYAPTIKTAHLSALNIDGLRIDYVHSEATQEQEKERARKAGEAAREAVDRPDFLFLIDVLHLTNSDLGYVNKSADPEYRVFLSNADFRLTNLTNRSRTAPAEASLEGKFMGSGISRATATFRPDDKGPDFDLMVEIQGTPVTRMNNLLRSHAKVDVVAGTFAVYSELSVHEGQISGYVKPFFRDLDIYDPAQDKDKSLLKKLREGVVDVLSKILENPRDEVATQFELSGQVENPEASTLQIILQLIRNGFIQAILPGFEQARGAGR